MFHHEETLSCVCRDKGSASFPDGEEYEKVGFLYPTSYPSYDSLGSFRCRRWYVVAMGIEQQEFATRGRKVVSEDEGTS
jgi:hypothetical protein